MATITPGFQSADPAPPRRRRSRMVQRAAIMVVALVACDATDPDPAPWPADGVTFPLGEYLLEMSWPRNGVSLAGSTTARMQVLESTMAKLTVRWLTGPGAADTTITTDWIVRSDSAFYYLVVFPGTAAPFLVPIARPGGADRIECNGSFPVPSSIGYYPAPLECSLRLVRRTATTRVSPQGTTSPPWVRGARSRYDHRLERARSTTE